MHIEGAFRESRCVHHVIHRYRIESLRRRPAAFQMSDWSDSLLSKCIFDRYLVPFELQ